VAITTLRLRRRSPSSSSTTPCTPPFPARQDPRRRQRRPTAPRTWLAGHEVQLADEPHLAVHADDALGGRVVAVDDRDRSVQDDEEVRRRVAGANEDLAGDDRSPLAGGREHGRDVLAETRERRVAVERVLRHVCRR
jgi:hypothetical protein